MIDIPSNFYLKTKDKNYFYCGKIEDMEYVYTYKKLNENGNCGNYDVLNQGTLSRQIDIYRRFKNKY